MSDSVVAAQLARAIGRRAKPQNMDVSWTFGFVKSMQAGPPKSLTLTLAGSATQVAGFRYLASYANPQANDYVLILRNGSDSVVVGPLA